MSKRLCGAEQVIYPLFFIKVNYVLMEDDRREREKLKKERDLLSAGLLPIHRIIFASLVQLVAYESLSETLSFMGMMP